MTIYEGGFKVNEKTWPVTIGEPERVMILKIQAIAKEKMGFDVTQRAVVSHAIRDLFESLTKG